MYEATELIYRKKSSISKEVDIGSHTSDKKSTVDPSKRESQFQYAEFHDDETSSYVLGYN